MFFFFFFSTFQGFVLLMNIILYAVVCHYEFLYCKIIVLLNMVRYLI